MTLRPRSQLLPATLEQRGTAVPFTTPTLTLARVRPDERHDLVLTVRGFGGSDGAYVVPWKSVPELCSMSVHDRALHEQIAANHAVTPAKVRSCALKVASTGLAGPAAAEAALAAIEAEERKFQETHFLLIVMMLLALDVDIRELLTIDPEAGEWRGAARKLLLEAGRHIGMEPTEFYGQSSALARVLAPIGMAQAATPGRLRVLIGALRDFRESIVNWGQNERSELAATAGYAGELAGLTAGRATDILAQLDKRIAQEGWILRNWKQEAVVVAAISNRVSWMLDGWEHIIPLWYQAHGEPLDVQRETVTQLIPLLPVFPRSEAMEIPAPAPPHMGPSRTARPDFELTARLEAARSRTIRK